MQSQIESNQIKGYQTAFDIAANAIAVSEPQLLAEQSGAVYISDEQVLCLEYLKKEYLISTKTGEIAIKGSSDEVAITTKVLLLNYIMLAKKPVITGEYIPFREIPNAATYEPSFAKRSINPMIKVFNNKADLLIRCAKELGGKQADIADTSVTIPVMPGLPVTYAIWHSDEEYPARGTILFDSSAKRFMNVECLVVAASNPVYEMMKIAFRA